MTERRRQRRIPIAHVMKARLVTDGVETLGKVIDLNNAGAFVACDLVLDKNTAVEVELQIPGEDKSLPLKAVVARRTEEIEGRTRVIPAGLGLVFMTDNVMERAFIQMAVLEALKGSLATTRMNLSSADPAAEENVRP
ncbi:MAG: hypothetical protein BMS9Abin37_1730 [Acidobacteriota bacterium]|nr:MAG: hypothetical protein BMS9Abin37_1730 [Acidobacteriota bacterium]